MNKHFFTAALLAVLPAVVGAATEPTDRYFSTKNPQLTQQEKEAIAIAGKWRAGAGNGVRVAAGADGAVNFVFGTAQHSIVCAVLQVCDVELQLGELVNAIELGDAVRWKVSPAISGVSGAEIQHLIIKPLDVGLDTSLIVTTNRRTYRLRLRSHRTDFMPFVSFTYPEDALAKWDAVRTREAKEQQERTIPQTGEDISKLHFNYAIAGKAPWKPVRVYNDGTRTVIQMPDAMRQTEAPTLLVVRDLGNFMRDKEGGVMVNYRIHGDRYIVDTVFDKAMLIAGVGSRQQRITITKEK